MNAQHNSQKLFASFEILGANKIKFFSFWGKIENEATCQTEREKQLCEFFYLLNGGLNFFNTAYYIATTGNTPQDFATLAEAPKEFPELYTDVVLAAWDFDGWKNVLMNALAAETETPFFDGLNAYFSAFFNGKTFFDRCTDAYCTLPVGTYLTDGTSFAEIIQQNGNTTFLLGGNELYPSAHTNLHHINVESIPTEMLTALRALRAKYEEQNDADFAHVAKADDKKAARQAKVDEKALNSNAGKFEKLFSKFLPTFDFAAIEPEQLAVTNDIFTLFAEKMEISLPTEWEKGTFSATMKLVTALSNGAIKAKTETDTKTESAATLLEFFTLSNTATIDELKTWMAANQTKMIGKGENNDRSQATSLYRTLKTAADAKAKAEAKAEAEAEAAPETAPKTKAAKTVKLETAVTEA
jgi:hypothetical protein